MKVTIQSRINLEEIPGEVKSMLKKISSSLFLVHEISKLTLEQEGVSDIMLKDMSEMMMKMEDIRTSLEDVNGIARGYLNAISQPPENLMEESDDNPDGS
tara:strand:+ start:412 stop:711 length:300 start_codon:yes stop_codon:yes gene_type:complete